MRIPKPLAPGAKIALITPASCMKETGEQREKKLQQCLNVLTAMGLQPVLYPTCRKNYGYLGGTDAERAADVMNAFLNPEVDGILCLRGGYGVQRILDRLDLDKIRNHPKWFGGYSDITALHIVLNQQCDLVTYHCPMPSTEMIEEDFDAYSREWLEKALFGKLTGELPSAVECETLHGGKAMGKLCGGNLSLVSSSLGTAFEVDTRNKILFLEDVGESPYRIDGMLNHLRLAGKLSECVGMIMGYYTDCEPKQTDMTLKQIFQDLLPDHIPVLCGYSCGHSRPTMTLPMGQEVCLDADQRTLWALHGEE